MSMAHRRGLNAAALVASAAILLTGLVAQHSLASARPLSVRVGTASVTAAPASVVSPPPRAVARVPARHAPRLVVLGDSVPAAARCACTGFGTLLARGAAQASGRDVLLTNAGTDGLTTSGLLAQLDTPGLAARLAQATVVTVTIGANDFDESQAGRPECAADGGLACYRSQLNALGGALDGVLARLRGLTSSSTRILVTGYWNVFLDGDVGARNGTDYVRTSDALTRAVNGVIAATARGRRVGYVDLYTPFKASGPRETVLLAPDGDHPSATGHALIAAALTRAVAF